MELLESLQFFENNWDTCNQDNQISHALGESLSSVSDCESLYSNELSKLEKDFLQECSQISEIEDTFNLIKSSSELLNNFNSDLCNSIGALQCIGQSDESMINSAKDILDFFTHYLPIIQSIKPKFSEIYEVHCFLQKYPGLKSIYSKTIKIFSLNTKFRIKSCRSFLLDNISQGKHCEEDNLKICQEYYDFYTKMNDTNAIKLLQEECIDKLATDIIYIALKKPPFNPFHEKKKEIVQKLLSLEVGDLSPENFPEYDYNVKTEFRIIKFITELSKIIEQALNGLSIIFPNELFSFKDFFTTQLKKKYMHYLEHLKFTKRTNIKNAMTWAFIFRVISFYDLTVPIDSPFQSSINSMIHDTIIISNNKSNDIYDEYMDKSRSPLLKEYKELDFPKNITDPQQQENYVNKTILILKYQIHPAVKKISLYYTELIKFRSNFKKVWYNRIIRAIIEHKNQWFLNYVTYLSGSEMIMSWFYTDNFEEKYYLTFISYMNLYISCYEELYNHDVTVIFNNYFNKYIIEDPRMTNRNIKPFIQSDSIDHSSIDSKFVTDNYQNYLSEVKKLIFSKLKLMDQQESKGFFESILSKVKNIDHIKKKDQKYALIGLVFLFASKFSYYYSKLLTTIKKEEVLNIPTVDRAYGEIMLLIEDIFGEKRSTFYTLFKTKFSISIPRSDIFK